MQRFGPGFRSGFSRRLSTVVESWLVSGLAAIALLAIASTASATAIVQVVWQETGTSTATVAPGTPLTAEILITPDTSGISSYGVTIKFSDDLMLAATPPEKELPSGFQFNLLPGLTTSATEVGSFEAGTLADGPTSGTFLAGLVHFVAVNPRDNGIDVTPGFFTTGIDGMFDNEKPGKAVDVQFIGASVVPEPTTALLLVSGLAGLAAFCRRQIG